MLEQELAELLVGSALVVMTMYFYYTRRPSGAGPDNGLTVRVGVMAVAVLVLSFTTTHLFYSIPHMQAQTDKRIQYGLTKFASRYQRYDAWGLAAELYERAHIQKPRDIPLIRDVAHMHQKLGDEQKTQEYVKKALVIDLPRFKRYPTWVSVNLSLAQTYQLIDEKAEVQRHLDNALIGARKKISKKPDSANAAYWLGKTHDLRGESQLAIQQFKRAFDLDPDSSKYREAYYNSRSALRSSEK
jgi:tetratricopeptide (TPR) repeat protein